MVQATDPVHHDTEAAGAPSGGGMLSKHAVARLRRVALVNWPLLAVLALFAAAAVAVPTLAPVATTDDWGYARSVEILVGQGRIEIFSVVAATAVFQVAWGALFALIFGPSLGVFRLSTVVMTALGGWALYALCRQLGVSPGRAALGAAAYLFNPLAFVLAFTFMTDPHFTALLLIATYFYARGLAPGSTEGWAIVAGSAVAGLAFLTRQQGALIPLAVVTYLLLARRLSPSREGLALLLRAGALPAAAAAGYVLWLRVGNGVPQVQTSFLRQAAGVGWGGTWDLVRLLTFVEAAYLGLFALPVVAAALPSLRALIKTTPAGGWPLICAWEALLVAGAVSAWAAGKRMPYVPQFFGSSGLGAPDVLGGRPRWIDEAPRGWLTVVCVASSLVLALVVVRRLRPVASPGRSGAGLVAAIGLWQAVGVLPPSYHYLGWAAGSLDRYLLPLLPLALCLALWAVRDVRLVQPLGWLVVAGYAIFAVAGTRDYLTFMDGVWRTAREAIAAGVPYDKLDAGSGWDGYHLYEYSRDNRISPRTKNGPWWVYFYAPATDSTYVVASKPLPGYVEVDSRSVSTWLPAPPTRLYLLRRPAAPWPPAGDAAPRPPPSLALPAPPVPTPSPEGTTAARDPAGVAARLACTAGFARFCPPSDGR